MKKDILKQYLSLRSSLESERAQLEARLREINETLSTTPKARDSKPDGRRKKMSAVARAKIGAAMKLKWAERKKAKK